MTQDLYISWESYHHSIEQLAQMVRADNWQFSSILCLARGGLRVGDMLSRLLDKPLAILSTASYGDSQQKGQLVIAQHITHTIPLGDRLLVVDDMVDSGTTLRAVLDWLKHPPHSITEIKTAVLWYKAHSTVAPDYFVHYLKDNSWIHQPFEVYGR